MVNHELSRKSHQRTLPEPIFPHPIFFPNQLNPPITVYFARESHRETRNFPSYSPGTLLEAERAATASS